jgi:hypothetical protein
MNAIAALRAGRPTATRVTNDYNDLIGGPVPGFVIALTCLTGTSSHHAPRPSWGRGALAPI